jgi:N-acetylneuraminate synthase
VGVRIGDRVVGPGQPVYTVAEIGINHNGDVEIAKRLIEIAASVGVDAVKFQKRTPEIATPPAMREQRRETPWGEMSYLEYRHRVEFGIPEYEEIDRYCKELGIAWFASPWDVPSVDFLERFDVVCHKVASASLTDRALLAALRETGRPVIASTGMSTMDEIAAAVRLLGRERLVLLHTTSTYPCPLEEVNLRAMDTLARRFGGPIGYSGHERGLQVSIAAVARGACLVERHFTLDRTMWGSDQAASLEPEGLRRLVRDIRAVEVALGDGVKRVLPGEEAPRRRLRRL